MAQQIAALRSENNTLRRFCTDRLLAMYENLTSRDVAVSESLRIILNLNRGEQGLNQHLREGIRRLETLIPRAAWNDNLSPAPQPLRPLPLSILPSSEPTGPTLPPLPIASNPTGTSLPSLPAPSAPNSPTTAAPTAAGISNPIEPPKKRGISGSPDKVDAPPKRQKL